LRPRDRFRDFRRAFSCWLKSVPADREGRWAAAIDGKTCCQGLDANGSPVQMLNVFLQQAKLTLDQWSVGGDKTNEPGSLKNHLSELWTAYLRAAAEAIQWSPLCVLLRLGFIRQG
jgi:hypothetical protein